MSSAEYLEALMPYIVFIGICISPIVIFLIKCKLDGVRSNNVFSVKLYKACLERGITDINTKEDKEAVTIIARNLSNNTSLEANEVVKLFFVGMERFKVEQQKELERPFYEKREKERQSVEAERKEASYIGTQKYIQRALWNVEHMKWYDDNAKYMATKRSIIKDPDSEFRHAAFWNGGAAGLAAYADAVHDNEMNKIRDEETRERGRYLQQNRRIESKRYNEYASKDNIAKFKDKLTDCANIEAKFQNLSIVDVNYKILESKNIEVTGKVKAINDSFIINKPAILDGSLLFSIKNSKGNVIGTGYYNAPGFNYNKLDGCGFSKEYETFRVLCYIQSYKTIATEKINIDITPNNLWYIEK